MKMKVDFVVTWVDGNDPKWLKEKNKYSPTNKIMNNDIRYRDYGTFRYWFRAVEKNAPWVNKIYLVTEGHLPKWLNVDAEKLVIVKHADFMKKEYLPTFNSNSIELNIHNIDGLSEHFVLFNDDMFLLNRTEKLSFFDKSGFPKDVGVYSPTVPYRDFSNIVFNDVRVINNNFNKKKSLKNNFLKIFNIKYGVQNFRTLVTLPWPKVLGYWNPHVTSSFLKSTFNEVWNKEFEILDQTSKNKFRTHEDVNQWLMRYFQIESGKFSPQHKGFGIKVTLNEFDKLEKIFLKSKVKILCVNDDFNVENYDIKMKKLMNLFERKFPEKSEYEV